MQGKRIVQPRTWYIIWHKSKRRWWYVTEYGTPILWDTRKGAESYAATIQATRVVVLPLHLRPPEPAKGT